MHWDQLMSLIRVQDPGLQRGRGEVGGWEGGGGVHNA